LSITNIAVSGQTCSFTLSLDGNNQNALSLSDGSSRYLGDFDGDGLDELLVFTGSSLALIDICENQYHVIWRADGRAGRVRCPGRARPAAALSARAVRRPAL